jgi:hypothetical protein
MSSWRGSSQVMMTITAESTTLCKGLKGASTNGNGGGTSALRLKGIKMMYPITRTIQIL